MLPFFEEGKARSLADAARVLQHFHFELAVEAGGEQPIEFLVQEVIFGALVVADFQLLDFSAHLRYLMAAHRHLEQNVGHDVGDALLLYPLDYVPAQLQESVTLGRFVAELALLFCWLCFEVDAQAKRLFHIPVVECLADLRRTLFGCQLECLNSLFDVASKLTIELAQLPIVGHVHDCHFRKCAGADAVPQ